MFCATRIYHERRPKVSALFTYLSLGLLTRYLDQRSGALASHLSQRTMISNLWRPKELMQSKSEVRKSTILREISPARNPQAAIHLPRGERFRRAYLHPHKAR